MRVNTVSLFSIATAMLLMPLCAQPSTGQVVPGAIIAGIEIGPAFYFGEFNSLEFSEAFSPHIGYDLGLALRYNLSRSFSLSASFGRLGLGYDINDSVRKRYSTNFFGPVGNATYLNSSVDFTPQNSISVSRYLLAAELHLGPGNRFVPFLSAGVGVIDFQASNDLNDTLPENFTGDYDEQALIFPLSGGADYFFTPSVSGFFRGTLYVTNTDYLDGYGHYLSYDNSPGTPGPGSDATPQDYMLSLTVGLNVLLYRPDTSSPPPLPPPPPTAVDSSRRNPPPPLRADTAAVPPRPEPLKPTDRDRDGDGITNTDEDGRFLTDPDDPDTDGDNLRDREEIFRHNTSPNNPDTDGDGIADGMEVYVYKTNPLVRDSDRDAVSDGDEVLRYQSNPLMADSDGDGINDNVEVLTLLSNPLNRDTDADGVLDGSDRCPTLFGNIANNGCP